MFLAISYSPVIVTRFNFYCAILLSFPPCFQCSIQCQNVLTAFSAFFFLVRFARPHVLAYSIVCIYDELYILVNERKQNKIRIMLSPTHSLLKKPCFEINERGCAKLWECVCERYEQVHGLVF